MFAFVLQARSIALNNKALKLKLTDKVVLILGEEVGGINYSLYDIIDLFIESTSIASLKLFCLFIFYYGNLFNFY